MLFNGIQSVDAITINNNNTGKAAAETKKDKLIRTDVNSIQLNVNTSQENITRAIEKVNENYMAENKKLEYSYHEQTGKYVVKVVDTTTHEVVNQIPSQKLLDYAEGLMEYLGLTVDKIV